MSCNVYWVDDATVSAWCNIGLEGGAVPENRCQDCHGGSNMPQLLFSTYPNSLTMSLPFQCVWYWSFLHLDVGLATWADA